MSGRYLTDLADVCRRAGLQVVELDGWQTRARSSGGYADGGPWCVMLHHTASAGNGRQDADYCTFGSSDRPVTNLVLGRDAIVYVCAAGATNTNGKGGPLRLSNGRTVAADQMNLRAVAIEMSNNGVGMAYPTGMVDAMFALVIALADAYLGGDVSLVAGHVDWTTRKIDPATAAAVEGGWRPASINSSGSWRLADTVAELQRRASSGATPGPEPTQEDDDVRLFTCPGDASRPAMLVGAGWRKVARSDEETAVMSNTYGPGVAIDARNYDVIASLACQASDGWP